MPSLRRLLQGSNSRQAAVRAQGGEQQAGEVPEEGEELRATEVGGTDAGAGRPAELLVRR